MTALADAKARVKELTSAIVGLPMTQEQYMAIRTAQKDVERLRGEGPQSGVWEQDGLQLRVQCDHKVAALILQGLSGDYMEKVVAQMVWTFNNGDMCDCKARPYEGAS